MTDSRLGSAGDRRGAAAGGRSNGELGPSPDSASSRLAGSSIREQRHEAIREILAGGSVPRQEHLVELLEARGFDVTQSSVSRDLRELKVAKIAGEYRLQPDPAVADSSLDAILNGNYRRSVSAGPNLLIVHTAIGAASRVALAFDRTAWPEVLGTIAGDDTIFVATPGLREQRRIQERLQRFEWRG